MTRDDAERRAVEAAAEALKASVWGDTPADDDWTPEAVAAVAAAWPHIARAVREQVAADIEAAGRADVEFLSLPPQDERDIARRIGAEDAWKAAVRIAAPTTTTNPKERL